MSDIPQVWALLHDLHKRVMALEKRLAALEKKAREGDQAKIPAVSTTSATAPSPDVKLLKDDDDDR
jgi:hypothetical protein